MMQHLGNDINLEEAETIISACFGNTGEGQINFMQFVQFMMYDTQDQSLFDQLEKKEEKF